MKKIILILVILCSIISINAYSQQARSNHSYNNLAFTQLPTVTISGYIDVNGAHVKQEEGYSERELSNVFTYEEIYDEIHLTTGKMKNKHPEDNIMAVDASLMFRVQGINDFGLLYGAVMEFNANSTYDSWNKDINTTKSYLYLETFLGKIEFGSELGASQKMKVDASNIARGPGGITGKYLNYINLPSIVNKDAEDQGAIMTGVIDIPEFILIPQLPTGHGGYAMGFNNLLYQCDINGNQKLDTGDEYQCFEKGSGTNYNLYFQEMENAVKISYYTPSIYGFQLGISYTPDTGNKGVAGRISTRLDTGDIDELIQFGATFNQTFYGLGFSLSFTAEKGTSESGFVKINQYGEEEFESYRQDLEAYQIGGVLTYFGLSVGGSFGRWQDSLQYKTTPEDAVLRNNDAEYYTFGIAYEFRGFNMSFTHIRSKFRENEYSASSFGVDYTMANGLLPYVEVTEYKFKSFDPIKDDTKQIIDNEGLVVLVGFLLNF